MVEEINNNDSPAEDHPPQNGIFKITLKVISYIRKYKNDYNEKILKHKRVMESIDQEDIDKAQDRKITIARRISIAFIFSNLINQITNS